MAEWLLVAALVLQLAGITITGIDIGTKVRRYRNTERPTVRSVRSARETIRRAREAGVVDGGGEHPTWSAIDSARAQADRHTAEQLRLAKALDDLVQNGYQWLLVGLGLTAAGVVLGTVASLVAP